MKTEIENPPAFACVSGRSTEEGSYLQEGMPLRDYFAAKEDGVKLVEGYSKSQIEEIMGEEAPSGTIENIQYHFRFQSKLQYMKADAMLKERSINP